MASFQAKIVWKRPRKRENKNYRFVPFLSDALQKLFGKTPLWYHFKPKLFGKCQESEKQKLQFRSVPT